MAEAVHAAPRTTTLQDAEPVIPSILDKEGRLLDACRVEQEFGLRVRELDPEAWDMDVFTLPSVGTHCREARARVDRVAGAIGMSSIDRADVMLAVGEAVSNAIRHGNRSNPEGSFTICCMATAETLYVSVSDPGAGFDPDHLPRMDDALLLESGRGVHCMNAVMDEVTFDFSSGTTVRMMKIRR